MQCVWSALPGFLGSQAHDKMACLKPHPSPVDPNLAKKHQQQQHHQHHHQHQQQLKRKRTNSCDPSPVKRQKPEAQFQPSPKQTHSPSKPQPATTQDTSEVALSPSQAAQASVATPALRALQATALLTKAEDSPQLQAPAPKTEPAMSHVAVAADRTRAHERIEANLNLQILLKHDELRLIEQELGKCQIALEQLRRCKVIPFPGQPGSQIAADAITSGVGPSLKPQAGLTRPSHMAPFGVTDGPYSRHYAQWLIPDPSFDPSLPRSPRLSTGGHSLQGRPIRSSYDSLISATTPRTGRGAVFSHSATLSGNYSVPRDRHAPLTVPRPSDGKLVKMVCKVCGKKDSANVQGFTNHCRIAHGINYASHSEAIVDCGQLAENDEVAAYVPPTPTEPKPVSNIVAITPQNTGKPLVHPLITASKAEQDSSKPLFANAARPTDLEPQGPSASGDAQFVGSSDSPHLSALLKKRGFNGDLKSLITTSKQKINLGEVSPLVSDEEDDGGSTIANNSAASTPQRLHSKPKSQHRNDVALSGVRIPGRARAGPSKLQINTSSSTVSGGGPSTAQSSQPSTATTPFTFVPQRLMVPDSFSSQATNISSSSAAASPMDVDGPEMSGSPEENSEISGSSANLSPHTVDTNPGLVTDNEDDADFVDSDQDERESVDETADGGRHVDMGVKVREDDGPHADELMQDLDHPSEDKPKPSPSLPNGVVDRRSSVASGGASTPRKRGRPRKNP